MTEPERKEIVEEMPDVVAEGSISPGSIVGRHSPQQLVQNVQIVRNTLSSSESSEEESREDWRLDTLTFARPHNTYQDVEFPEYGLPVTLPIRNTDDVTNAECGVPATGSIRNTNVGDTEFPGVAIALPIRNTDDVTNAGSSIDIDELKSVKPPRRGEEFERLESPPSSSHSSLCEGFDATAYRRKRNELIAENILKKEVVGDEENSHKLVILDNRMVTYCGFDDDPNHSDTDESESSYIRTDFDSTLRQILQDTIERRDFIFESVSGGFLGIISFCYMRFQRAHQMKWNVIMLRRFEEILLGRGQFLDVIPTEWEDYEGEFVSIYGPMLETSENYRMLVTRFQVARLRMYIEMLNREVAVLNSMMESRRLISEWSHLALEIKETRLQLEFKLNAISEANLDMNPYSNGICMDFFGIPRPIHSIMSYEIRPKEYDSLIEYNTTEEDDIIRFEGYNPALIDVGCIFQWKVVGDQKRGVCAKRRWPSRKAVTEWNQTRLELSAEILEYPVGVESNMLVKKYRQKRAFYNNEPIFGKYSDKDGVIRIPDVFYHQYLRGDMRIILFPALYEGIVAKIVCTNSTNR
ncbi:unnamed protein product [Orchesella dallaii]|uniref:Uncharacterized protein n=1 Tax=Orchesella dallaii TaxID=48710 RepID=A0ABP1QXA7_9HEXA